MKILFLTTILLSKNCNGGEVASQCFIDALRNLDHQVTVVGYLRKGDKFEHNSQETLVIDERYTETNKSKLFAILWLVQSFFKKLPYSSVKYYSRAYISLVKKLITANKYSVIIIDHAQLAWISRFLTVKSKLIAIAHNVEFQIYEENSQKARNSIAKFIYQREARLIRLQEELLLGVVQQIWTLTEDDSKYFSQLTVSGKTRIFGIAPRLTTLQNQLVSKCFDICLLGSWTWQANVEALQWFIEAVYPYLPNNLSIHIAGKGADWLSGKYPNIFYRGVVPNAQEFMAQAKVVAIPTLTGGGIQIKTLDAIASGSFIVATPVSLRGISYLPSTVRVAKDPEEFANFLVTAITSSSTDKAQDDAKDWYSLRRENFINDIANAISEM